MGAVVGNDGVENQGQARGEQHSERAGAGQQAERIALGIACRQQDRHEHAAQGKNSNAGRAGKRSEKGAHQGGHDRRPATELPDQRLKHPYQALGRPALRDKIAREGKDGDAG